VPSAPADLEPAQSDRQPCSWVTHTFASCGGNNVAQNAASFARCGAKNPNGPAPAQHQLMVCASSGACHGFAKARVYHPRFCQVIAFLKAVAPRTTAKRPCTATDYSSAVFGRMPIPHPPI